jgi:hypothetical protein
MKSLNFFLPGLAWNHDPPHLSLQRILLPLSYWLRWGSHNPFALAGLKLWPSQSQLPKYLGWQAWAISCQLTTVFFDDNSDIFVGIISLPYPLLIPISRRQINKRGSEQTYLTKVCVTQELSEMKKPKAQGRLCFCMERGARVWLDDERVWPNNGGKLGT